MCVLLSGADTWLQACLGYSLDINYTCRHGSNETALQAATRAGHTGIVARLIELGADVNRTNGGWWAYYTPLHLACTHGHLATARALVLLFAGQPSAN